MQVIRGDCVIDLLGNVGCLIADAFQIACDKQQMRRRRDRRWVFDHERDEIAEDAVVKGIDLGVTLKDFSILAAEWTG